MTRGPLPSERRARGRYGEAMPPDFAELAPEMTRKALMRHYHVQHRAISRWLSEAGIREPGQWMGSRPLPDDFATVAPTLRLFELMKRYEVSHNVIHRWSKLAGVEPQRPPVAKRAEAPKGNGVKGRNVGAGHRFVQAPPLSGIEEEAAHFLRRHYPAVYHCDPDGHANPKGKLWLCGARVLTPAELVAKAKDKGWDPDAWKRIAA